MFSHILIPAIGALTAHFIAQGRNNLRDTLWRDNNSWSFWFVTKISTEGFVAPKHFPLLLIARNPLDPEDAMSGDSKPDYLWYIVELESVCTVEGFINSDLHLINDTIFFKCFLPFTFRTFSLAKQSICKILKKNWGIFKVLSLGDLGENSKSMFSHSSYSVASPGFFLFFSTLRRVN